MICLDSYSFTTPASRTPYVKTVRIEISVRNSNLKGIILDFNMEMLQFKIDIIQHG